MKLGRCVQKGRIPRHICMAKHLRPFLVRWPDRKYDVLSSTSSRQHYSMFSGIFSGSGNTSNGSSGNNSNIRSKRYRKRKRLNYSQDELYELVSDVRQYPSFVPWCLDAKVLCDAAENRGHDSSHGTRTEQQAELVVGFGSWKERYTSRVVLQPKRRVEAHAADASMFRELTTIWTFVPDPKDKSACYVDFDISFQFQSALHARLSEVAFDDVVEKMIAAFEKRCHDLYGSNTK